MAHDFRLVGSVVVEKENFDRRGALHDVIIRDDVARPIDDEPRAGSNTRLLSRLTGFLGVTEEASEQVVATPSEEFVRILPSAARLRTDIDHHRALGFGNIPKGRRRQLAADRFAVHRGEHRYTRGLRHVRGLCG